MIKRVIYLAKLSLVNFIGLVIAFCGFYPILTHQYLLASKSTNIPQTPFHPPVSVFSTEVYGRPIRLLIPAAAIDIPIDPGYYSQSNNSWTLSGYRAQFAMDSALANNIAGNTFIYGHNNDFVFGSLRHNTPVVGEHAIIFTNNGHAFEYAFTRSYSIGPNNTNVFNYSGAPPILTIQTCTGSLNEWRTMYQFSYVGLLSWYI